MYQSPEFSFQNQRQVDECERTRRPVFIRTDVGELVGAEETVNIGRYTRVDTGIDSVAVFADVIITSQIIHEIGIAPMIIAAVDCACALPIGVICPGTAAPEREIDVGDAAGIDTSMPTGWLTMIVLVKVTALLPSTQIPMPVTLWFWRGCYGENRR